MEGCEFIVKPNLIFSPCSVKLFVKKDIEAIGVKLQVNNLKLTFIKMSKSPNRNEDTFLLKLENLLMDLTRQKKFILIREFKILTLYPQKELNKKQFFDWYMMFGLNFLAVDNLVHIFITSTSKQMHQNQIIHISHCAMYIPSMFQS